MEFTVDEALKKGIEAHKTGLLQEAERLYTAILQTQPKHPDANHNMGVLAVGVGKIQEALPFFKLALEANQSIGQFWLSIIEALVKLDRIADAQALFDKAKYNGVKGEAFDQLEQRLAEQKMEVNHVNKIGREDSSYLRPDVLDTINLNKALRLAERKSNEGRPAEAKSIYEDILQKFPKHKQALNALDLIVRGATATPQDPSSEQLQYIINLYMQGHLQQALSHANQMLEEFPYSVELHSISGASLAGLMQFDAAIDTYKKAIKIKPDYADAYYNIGSLLQERGDLDAAICRYKQALKISPDYVKAYNNMGNALKDKGDLEAAIESYKKAQKFNPNYSEAFYNMGIALNIKGSPDAAIECYKKALKIKPDYAEAYNNMGLALQGKGDFVAAIKSYSKAVLINPDHAEAYYSMGIALSERGDLKAAIESYKKALKIKPHYSDALFNLSGLAENISESKGWVEHCLRSDPSYLKAKLTLIALQFYEGDKSDFNDLIQSTLKDHSYVRSFSWAFNLPELPALYFHRWALFDYVIGASKKDRPFYEFGVWRGEAFRYLIKTFKKGYGFDTFEGIPEDWHEEKAGSYSSDGNIPQIEGGEFIVGKFEDTLPVFFLEPRPAASVINFDADLYSSTICALNHTKSIIDEHTILIFDEFIMNQNWEQDEYKALNEFCMQNSYVYEVLAISFFTKQVAVRLVDI